MRLPAGDDDRGRGTTRLPVPLARGLQHVVVEVNVVGREPEEVGVGAAAERRDVGFAQRLADVDVLAGNAIDLDRLLSSISSVQKIAACLSLPSLPSHHASSILPS